MQPIDRFVSDNAGRMPERHLYRLAADLYRQRVRDARRVTGGASLPDWPWDEIREHYVDHVVDSRLARLSLCREMRAMRGMIMDTLVERNTAEGGASDIDRVALDMYTKLLERESREHRLLESMPAAPRRSDAATGHDPPSARRSESGASRTPPGYASGAEDAPVTNGASMDATVALESLKDFLFGYLEPCVPPAGAQTQPTLGELVEGDRGAMRRRQRRAFQEQRGGVEGNRESRCF